MVINTFRYFVPLTSFKKKHLHLSNSIDFMKIGKIAAINLNKMIPVPIGCYFRVVVEKEEDPFYRKLLYRERRYIKKHQQMSGYELLTSTSLEPKICFPEHFSGTEFFSAFLFIQHVVLRFRDIFPFKLNRGWKNKGVICFSFRYLVFQCL